MSYRDPYAQGARDPGVEYYNPYQDHSEPHRTYEQGGYDQNHTGGYRDEPFQPPAEAIQSTYVDPASSKEHVTFGSHKGTHNRSASEIRAWRYDHQGNLWTAGGRGRCIGRFCCCTLLIFVFLLLSIVLSLALWIQPPNVTIGDVQQPTTGSAIQPTNEGITVNLGVNISVHNPNYFSVALKEIKVDITYPVNNTNVGGGSLKNVVFDSDSTRNITFPFAIQYKMADDPNYRVLADLANKCGVLTGTKSNIVVNYNLTLRLRILFITVSPVISNKFNFVCPIDNAQIQEFAKAAGIDLTSILGGLVGAGTS